MIFTYSILIAHTCTINYIHVGKFVFYTDILYVESFFLLLFGFTVVVGVLLLCVVVVVFFSSSFLLFTSPYDSFFSLSLDSCTLVLFSSLQIKSMHLVYVQ